MVALIVAIIAGLGGFYYWHQAVTSTPKTVLKSKIKLVAIGDSLTQGVGDQKQ